MNIVYANIVHGNVDFLFAKEKARLLGLFGT